MIFAIFSVSNPTAIRAAIEATYPGEFYELAAGQYFVRATATSKEVSERLGLTEGTNGAGVVVACSSYYGRESNQLWEWLKLKWDD